VALLGTPSAPHTPRTPLTPSNAPTVYNTARELFARSADPGRLIGREAERDQLESFIQNGIRSKSGQCLYVSGPPGTGKSALVTEVCHDIRDTPDVRTAYINCMSVKRPRDIYSKLIEELIDDDEELANDEMAHLRAIFVPKKKSSGPVYVVTLDEIDHLLTLGLEMLYNLFEWSLLRSSRLILIGIANALDLTDRFLPRLKARNLRPRLLPFLPYTAPQIASVITAKLQTLSQASLGASLDHTPFVHPTAVQFCSKKVASQTGDLRKAFDIMRRTIDLVENETRQKHRGGLNAQIYQSSPSRMPLKENPNLSSAVAPPIAPEVSLTLLSPSNAPRATIAHVARVSASALSNGTPQRLQTLNLQQKAALCTLISLEKSNRRRCRSILDTPSKTSAMNTAPSVRKLYDTYRSLCKRENTLHPLTATEFADVVEGLETLGLVGKGDAGGFTLGTLGKKAKGGAGDERRMVSWVSEGEIKGCLEGVGGTILKGLLLGDE
jgi:cell division control protein 6